MWLLLADLIFTVGIYSNIFYHGKANMLIGKVTLSKWFCLSFDKDSTLKGQNLLPMRTNSVPLKPFSAGDSLANKKWSPFSKKASVSYILMVKACKLKSPYFHANHCKVKRSHKG